MPTNKAAVYANIRYELYAICNSLRVGSEDIDPYSDTISNICGDLNSIIDTMPNEAHLTIVVDYSKTFNLYELNCRLYELRNYIRSYRFTDKSWITLLNMSIESLEEYLKYAEDAIALPGCSSTPARE